MPKSDIEFLHAVFSGNSCIVQAKNTQALSTALVDWGVRMGADAAWVGWPDADGQLDPKAANGAHIEAYLTRLPVAIRNARASDSSIAGRAWRTRQVQTGILAGSAPHGGPDDAEQTSEPWVAYVAVPLCGAEQCAGLLFLYSKHPQYFSSVAWVAALDQLALLAGSVLDRLLLEAEEDRLRSLALRDSLTGIPNKAALENHLAWAIPRARRSKIPLVIALLDLDKFKPINDLFGHDAGDRVLQEMATRLQASRRSVDFVARLSGDEFVIVLEGITNPAEHIDIVTKRLLAPLGEPVRLRQISWRCGASLGLTLLPSLSATDLPQALREADQALRVNKTDKDRPYQWWSPRMSSLALEPPANELTNDAAHLYSPAWATVLITLTETLQRCASAIVNEFYEKLSLLPKSKSILEALSAPELEHLKAQQVQNIFTLAGFGLTALDHRDMALRVGRIHCIVGLDREELVRSRGLLTAALHKNLDTAVHGRALSVLGRRLTRDLAYQTEAYQTMHDARQRAALCIAKLAWEVTSYTSLARGVVEILSPHDEIGACSVGRPDSQGVFRFEAIAGKAAEYFSKLQQQADRYITTDAAHPQGQGPTSRAWRSGTIQRTVNVATDPHAASWRSIALSAGLRSSAAIPLSQPNHSPLAILTLYCELPGGYSSSDQQSFLELIQTLLGFAVARIQNLEGRTRTVPYATRQHWSTLLRSNALELHYQPLLDLKTGRAVRVEVLARLRDGAQLLLPGDFFPTLSPDDFLHLYVQGLEQALHQRNEWAAAGLEVGISINLPPSALGDKRYLDATRIALERHSISKGTLMLEILENEALPYEQDLCAILEPYKSLGVLLAEDDLGSGYSNLSRLRQVPFDWIKIDKSFVNLEAQDPSDVLRFIYQLTRLGQSLNKTVVVEGVESLELLDAIMTLGVDLAQGYAIARPMPAEEVSAWMCSHALLNASYRPHDSLVKLARLLVWEERLHLVMEDPPTLGKLSELTAHSDIYGRDTPIAWNSPDLACKACQLPNFFTGMNTLMPADPGQVVLHQTLFDTALKSGTCSENYGLARQKLIEAIISPILRET